MPIKEEINVVRTTNAIAVPVPFKRFSHNEVQRLAFPLAQNSQKAQTAD